MGGPSVQPPEGLSPMAGAHCDIPRAERTDQSWRGNSPAPLDHFVLFGKVFHFPAPYFHTREVGMILLIMVTMIMPHRVWRVRSLGRRKLSQAPGPSTCSMSFVQLVQGW